MYSKTKLITYYRVQNDQETHQGRGEVPVQNIPFYEKSMWLVKAAFKALKKH